MNQANEGVSSRAGDGLRRVDECRAAKIGSSRDVELSIACCTADLGTEGSGIGEIACDGARIASTNLERTRVGKATDRELLTIVHRVSRAAGNLDRSIRSHHSADENGGVVAGNGDARYGG